MGQIGPRRTFKELEASAQITREGKGDPQLPGVTADALQMSPDKDYKDNRKLAELIGHAMLTLKGQSGGKPLFVIGWRLYPNSDNPEYWNPQAADHKCSCGCGCTCVIGSKNTSSGP